MRWALVLLTAGGCQVVFPLEPELSSFEGTCPSGFKSVVGAKNKYLLISSGQGWFGALDGCISLRTPIASVPDAGFTHLVVLDDQAEATAMTDNLLEGNAVWFGLDALILAGHYDTVTTQRRSFPPETGAPWAAGEPADGDCVVLQPSGELDALFCGQTHDWVCECDGFPDDPSKRQ